MVQAEKEYEMSRRKRIERLQRIMAVVSIVSFGGSAVFGTAQLFSSALKPSSESSTTAVPVAESPLAGQARGYELVLQREPENQTALEGLVNVRLEMKDAKGAVQPLEKLVKLYPGRQDYKELLERVKQPAKESGGERPESTSKGGANR
ncbi:MAG: tetratricopeptide repeat protein [Oscillatoria princeps RMCB-10]|jgi:cytochrome c-type biogenesis protein CcmH/NrfG|nr:tetratricopeptide repeat protein [Oscillatoria princeps RMCB-10]